MSAWTSDSTDELIPALATAISEFPSIPKDGYNPHFKSRFSTLKAIQAATKPILEKHGLAIFHFPSGVGPSAAPGLTTWLVHKPSGQFIADTAALSLAKSDPQAQGSAITYMRRYAWSSILGLITDEDDDGNGASLSDKQAAPSRLDQGKLDEIKRLADESGLGREGVSELAKKLFGKPVLGLSKQEGDKLAGELAKKVTEKALA